MAGTGKVEIQIGATDNASPKIKGIGKNIEAMGKTFTNVGKGMMAVGAGIVASIGLMVNNYNNAGDAVHDLAIKTGFSTESLSQWKYVAEQSGTSIDQIELGIKNMTLALVAAAGSTDISSTAIGKLGLNIDDLMAMKPEEQFDTITTALAGVEDQTMLVSAASEIFGTRVGTDLLPMLATGKTAISDLKQEAIDLNLVFSKDAADAADDFNDSKDKLKASLEGIGNSIATAVMPSINDLIEKLTNGLKPVLKWIKDNPDVFDAILKIGGAILAAGGILFAIGKLIGIIKDLRLALITVQSLMGPIGWANLLAGVAAAVTAISAYKAIESATSEGGYQHGGTVPGRRGQPVSIIAHGGERYAGVNNSYMGGLGSPSIIVNVQGSVISERNLVNVLRDEFIKIKNRNTSTGFA